MSALPPGVVVVESTAAAGGWRGRLRVERDSPLFAGHFDGRPILPGIAHLALALAAAGLAHGSPLALAGVRALRLRHLVAPGDLLDGTVDPPDLSGHVRFEFRKDGAVAAAGALAVVPAPHG